MAKESKARQYRQAHLKRLFALSGNQCACPECFNHLIARDETSIIAKICHIEAASANGPRWNVDMTDDQRRHFDNLVLLCDECHVIIDNKDNEDSYPKELLVQWKKRHESKLLYSTFDRKPTLLNMVISCLTDSELAEESDDLPGAREAFEIQEKIEYNSVQRNRPLIEEFRVFNGKLNAIYQTLEKDSSFKLERLFRNIKRTYLKSKGKYISESEDSLSTVQEHADDIFEDVEDELLKLATEGQGKDTFSDDLSFGVSVVMVDAFMRCKILEEPQS